MQCVIAGKLVGYSVVGNASRVALLLHGWGADRHSLDTLSGQLSSNYTVVSLDFPGFGESDVPPMPWGVSEYSVFVSEFVKKIGYSRIDLLLGHSNGGAICVKLVASGLVDPDKLVLIAASGVRSREKGRKALLKVAAKAGKVTTRLLPSRVRDRLKKKWYKTIGSEMLDRPGMEKSFQKIIAEDMLIDAMMISTPTLLIYGTEDRATPLSHGAAYHRAIEGSRLVTVAGVGHYSFLDEPEVVWGAITEFLAA